MNLVGEEGNKLTAYLQNCMISFLCYWLFRADSDLKFIDVGWRALWQVFADCPNRKVGYARYGIT